MKARIVQNIKSDIVLSIGMILKNEEKMLPSCLAGIKPLLDAVPSELVIVDTGSEDKTIEIAGQYTDKIYHFDWVNDFSAARNFSLSKCTGEWFMFLDADDHFADVSEMIKFFGDKKIRGLYNTASYITRNYNDMSFTEYMTLYVHRIARRTDELRFEGSIHENFAGWNNPHYYFSSYAYHYGYAFETPEHEAKKAARNLTLLEKELEKDPDNLRLISHTVPCMKDEDPAKRELILRGLELAGKSDDPYIYNLFFCAFSMYKAENNTLKAIEIINEAISRTAADSAVLVELYAMTVNEYYNSGNYEKAEELFEKYDEYYRKYEARELDNSILSFILANHISPDNRRKMQNMYVRCLAKQKKYDELIKLYAETLKEINTDRAAYFERGFAQLYYKDKSFAEHFADIKGEFAELMQICAEFAHENEKHAQMYERVEEYVNKLDGLPEGYSEAVWLCLVLGVDLTGLAAKINHESLTGHVAVIAKEHENLCEVLLSYKDDGFWYSGIGNLLLGVTLYENALSGAEKKTSGIKAQIYANYTRYLPLYVSNVYNPALLNEADIGVLPETHRFGYYIAAAEAELEAGRKTEYVQQFKKALASCKSMNNVIKFLLDEFMKTF